MTLKYRLHPELEAMFLSVNTGYDAATLVLALKKAEEVFLLPVADRRELALFLEEQVPLLPKEFSGELKKEVSTASMICFKHYEEAEKINATNKHSCY